MCIRDRCRKCNGSGHFEAVCKTKEKQTSGRGPGGSRKPDVGKKGGVAHHVRQVETEGTQGDDCEYTFGILDHSNVSSDEKISVKIEDLPVTMIIDSGASCNVIGRNVWEYLKANKVACVSTKASKKLYAYGSNQPLKVAGVFNAEVSVGGSVLSGVEFVFIENGGHVLLGRETAISLGVLKLGAHVNSLEVSTDGAKAEASIFEKFPGCCEGIGKLKDFQLKVPSDSEVQPVSKPIRRGPYHLRDKLSTKLGELVELDIIEKVSGPSLWDSPVVVVTKPSADIRLLVDMRQANMAVKRERFQIPTTDEVLQDLNQSKFFSKLDLTFAYRQIELSPESRDITTFGTHKGLYRYKRLMVGISCAPEMYQKVLHRVVFECDGAHNSGAPERAKRAWDRAPYSWNMVNLFSFGCHVIDRAYVRTYVRV